MLFSESAIIEKPLPVELVSIIICTYNRASLLKECLESLTLALASLYASTEILVVNNASSDSTSSIVEDFITGNRSMNVRLLHEQRQGLSFARNTGICNASGNVICFLDDDVIVPPGWLEGMLSAFTLDRSVCCVAGQARLHWRDAAPPFWVDDQCCRFYSAYSHGDQSHILPVGEDFFGVNFALTRKAIDSVGLFETHLGRTRQALLSGEDSEYSQRIWDKGLRIAYSAEGLVYHQVPADRITFKWMARRNLWAGITNFVRRKNFLYPVRCIPKILTNMLVLCAAILLMDKRMGAKACFRLSNALGPLYGLYLSIKGRLPTPGSE